MNRIFIAVFLAIIAAGPISRPFGKLADWVRPPVQAAMFHSLSDGGDKVIAGRDGWLFYRPDVRYLVERDASDVAERAIVQFRDQLRARGIRMIVVPVPGKPSVHPDKLTGRIATPSPSVAFLESLERQGVETVNLFGLPARYLMRDTHWTPETAAAAAGVVAAKLDAYRGGVDFKTARIRAHRRSDIIRMIQAPGIERYYPDEVVECEQVIDYKDDPQSPVLVLGDSFLRIYQIDEPRNSGFIAHLARHIHRPVASIVNDGGASTLVRQELARRPQLLANKRVVVWEFVERDIRFGVEGWQNVPLP